MKKGRLALIAMVLTVIVLATLVMFSIVLINRPTVPLVTLPTPNAYDTLQRAGKRITGCPDDYATTSNRNTLEAFLAKNAPALTLIEQSLDQPCIVPIDYEKGIQPLLDGIGPIRQAIRLLHAHARLAELDGDRAREAMLYAKMFAISSKSANGGLLVNAMAASAYEKLALRRLKELAGGLSTVQQRELLVLLESANRQPTDLEQLLEREHLLVTKQLGTLAGMLLIWQSKPSSQPALQRFIKTDTEVVELNRQILDTLRQ
jgi:hypothetical protein